jgi:hypothetical protein
MAAMGRAPLVGAGPHRSRDTDVVAQAAATLPPPKTVVTPPPPVPAGDDDGRAPCGAGDGHHA